MKKQLITSGSPFEVPIGYSRAVRIGNLIAVSGTAPISPDGSTACPGDPYGQTIRCLNIIKNAIQDGGGTLDNVVRTRVYITDAAVWEQVGKAHGEVFGKIRPASTFVVVKGLLSPDWFVEIEADCWIGD